MGKGWSQGGRRCWGRSELLPPPLDQLAGDCGGRVRGGDPHLLRAAPVFCSPCGPDLTLPQTSSGFLSPSRLSFLLCINNPCGLWCLKIYFQVRSIEAIGHMKFSRNKTQEKHEQCYPVIIRIL